MRARAHTHTSVTKTKSIVISLFFMKFRVKYFRAEMIFKLTALLEYIDLLQNLHVRNFCIQNLINISTKTKVNQHLY